MLGRSAFGGRRPGAPAQGGALATDILGYALEYLPPAPARVLAVGGGVGTGRGDGLAAGLTDRGYDVASVGSDSRMGPAFEAATLDRFPDSWPFEAALVNLALHRTADLRAAVAGIARLLRPGAPIVVHDFGWDSFTCKSAAWLHAALREDEFAPRFTEDWAYASPDPGELVVAWLLHHRGLHGHAELVSALHDSFCRVSAERVPFLYRHPGGVSEQQERDAIETGDVAAIGLQWVGRRG